MGISATSEAFPIAGTFAISRGSKTEARVVVATIDDGQHSGRGECVPYGRYGESVESVTGQIARLELVPGRSDLQSLMPPGAARNAVDCALWDLQAARTGRRVWELAGLARPVAVQTAYTISLDSPAAMRVRAAENAHRPVLKIKLGGEGDMDRLEAVRAGAPRSAIIVDANEGWDADLYRALVPYLQRLGVQMVEQPLAAGADAALGEIARPVPVCADESCHDRASLPSLVGKYDAVNIKLDKAGGLTEALALRQAARDAGLHVMVGCMVATSLSMAPAVLLAQGADWVDLDGPLLLAGDRPKGLLYDQVGVHPPERETWG